jgi:hypothetical protein
MKLEEIKKAVDNGKIVHWKKENYIVKYFCGEDKYYIECTNNGNVIGLTWSDNKTLNGEEKDFFISEKVYNVVLGYLQYPGYLPNHVRSKIVKLDYFTDENGFCDDKKRVIAKLNKGEVINNLGNLIDTLIVRIK